MTLILLYWRQIVILAAISAASLFAYNKIYSIGYDKAEAHYKAQIKVYEDRLDARINNLEAFSSVIIRENAEREKEAAKQFKAILNASKGSKTYVINNENCVPSESFMKSYTEALKKANSK